MAMISARLTPVNEPRPFGATELFFSLTDSKGRIRYGNEVFTRVSGYAESELIGKPHNVIRHPDVPRCVFRLLWSYLEAGKTIAAYVKNLAADGRYYWVLAVAAPCRDGYVSVRLKPSSPLFDAVQAAYAETLKIETQVEAEHGKSHAIETSLEHLASVLRDHGFETYDEFMRAALKTELKARGEEVGPLGESRLVVDGKGRSGSLLPLHRALGRVGESLAGVFDSLDVFESLSRRLGEKHDEMEELGPSLTFLALNTHISASRLGEQGAVLSVVSRSLSERSKEADRLIKVLTERMGPACDRARQIAFDVAIAQLEARVCESFVEELRRSSLSGTSGLVAASLDELIAELVGRCGRVTASLEAIRDDIALMASSSSELAGQVERMKVAQINGKIDIAARPDAQAFGVIFDEVAKIVRDARSDCEEVAELLESTKRSMDDLQPLERSLRTDLREVGDTVAAAVAGEPAALAGTVV